MKPKQKDKNMSKCEATPKVSVCMPVYNAAPYLRECIDSILTQTFTDFELLIVDDGSTDCSREIVRSYDDPRIRLVCNKHDYIKSLNTLLREARGKYIARMDADDVMRRDRLETQFSYMEKTPHIDILGAGMQCFGDNDSVCPPCCTGELGYMELMESCGLFHPTVFIRKKSIDEANLEYRKQYIYAEDYAFWVEAVRNGLVLANIEDIVINYRVSPFQLTSTQKGLQREHSVAIRNKLTQSWLAYVNHYLDDTAPVVAGKNLLTVIIPFYNEGEELGRTIESIRNTAGNNVDIIAVNDKSNDGIDYEKMVAPMNVTIVNNPCRMGPAMSKEKGVQSCGTPYFILLDAHMRFYQSGWESSIIKELSQEENQILCCQTKSLRLVNGVVKEEHIDPTYGAFIYLGVKRYTPMSVWNPNPNIKSLKTGHIPCVLGASYASSKTYWNHLRGFRGLLCYGCEEPFISLKAWLEGGKCKFVPDVTIGHIYKDYSTVALINAKYVYNFLFISHLLFPASLRCRAEAVVRSLASAHYEAAVVLLNASKDYRASLKSELSHILRNGDFENIKTINYVIHPNAETNLNHMLSDLPEILSFCKGYDQIAANVCLFHGRTGLAILFLLYSKYSNEERWKYLAMYLISEINRYFVDHASHLYSFSSGITGIGWGLLYMADNDLVPYKEVGSVLERIDSSVAFLAPSRMKDLSMETGYTGLVAYCTARIGFCKRHMVSCSFPEDFIQEIVEASSAFCRNSNNPSDIYSYSIHSLASSLKSEDWETTKIDFMDIMDLPTYIPKDRAYWKIDLKSGCLGYAINLLITKQKVNENK